MKTQANYLTQVAWRDLVPLSTAEKMWELTLRLPWLGLSLWLYQVGWWRLGAMASFYFFLTGLRQSHNAQHYSLGLSHRIQDTILFILSGLMLASMHAVQVTHLHHHRHCLAEADVEGATARKAWWRALLEGPLFIGRLHWFAWQLAGRVKRRWILAELAVMAAWLGLVFGVFKWPAWRWHAGAMLVGECFAAFFAVWTVHHDCDSDAAIGRTQRGRWWTALTYSMFLHAEHHLFPAVPTIHLARLAERLDAAGLNYQPQSVFKTGSRQPQNADSPESSGQNVHLLASVATGLRNVKTCPEVNLGRSRARL